MKILQLLSGQIASGAGRGALALYRGLRARGVDTRILGRLEKVLPLDVDGYRFSRWDWLKTGILNRLYLKGLHDRHGQPDVLFHPISNGHDPRQHPLFDWADLVHVQWAQAAMLGPDFWRAVPAISRPLIFTLRDMWLFTGGCHFSGACIGYQKHCTDCPILVGASDEVTTSDLAFKRRFTSQADGFVAISKHVAKMARASTVLRDADIRIIPNSVNVAQFNPADKIAMRRSLGLPEDRFIIGFGAMHLSETRKGSLIIQQIMKDLANDAGVHWAIFGQDPFPLPDNASWTGAIEDDTVLSSIYAACDLFVMPSLQETFGKTTAEALSTGIPVLAFKNTPAEEIIQHGKTGWVVPLGDQSALVRCISEVRNMTQFDRHATGMAGREHVLANYAPDIVANAHMELYAEKLERHRMSATA